MNKTIKIKFDHGYGQEEKQNFMVTFSETNYPPEY